MEDATNDGCVCVLDVALDVDSRQADRRGCCCCTIVVLFWVCTLLPKHESNDIRREVKSFDDGLTPLVLPSARFQHHNQQSTKTKPIPLVTPWSGGAIYIPHHYYIYYIYISIYSIDHHEPSITVTTQQQQQQ